MKLLNPLFLIKEELSEAATFSEKFIILFIASWAAMLSSLVIMGVGAIVFEMITNPSTFNSVTFGVFDTLG